MLIQYLFKGGLARGLKAGPKLPKNAQQRGFANSTWTWGSGHNYEEWNWTNRKRSGRSLLMEFWSLWIGRCWFCLVMPPCDPCPSQTACTVAITMSSKATKSQLLVSNVRSFPTLRKEVLTDFQDFLSASQSPTGHLLQAAHDQTTFTHIQVEADLEVWHQRVTWQVRLRCYSEN